ncbi:alpha/beta fold hydrolase [Nocardia concava]|uniref:alpha/beta fold hydrolase n=1 Tax=Nocardia concava TaxID=257281 RepID=UPI000304A9EF|nr:alpha/beta hydrolase [Nocardia concava]
MSHTIDLSHGTLRYLDTGDGPPVVFLHGFLLNSNTWRNVVPAVAAAGYRCLAPDLPLGGHSLPMPDADLTVPGVASLIEEFLERLDLREVTLVANDSGGAITQVLLVRRPERVARAVLAGVDCYEYFPPPILRWATALAPLPGSVRVLIEAMRFRPLQRLPFTLGGITQRPVPREVMDGYLTPSRLSAAIRNDLRRFILDVSPKRTLAAARHFAEVTIPVLVVWGRHDRTMPPRFGQRLADDLPNGTLRLIDDAQTLIQEDQPEALTRHILEFLAATVAELEA